MPYNIVGISVCAAGIAHTYMAAEALLEAGRQRGDNISIETQGALGAEDVLTSDAIEQADVVIIAADVAVDLTRFQKQRVYMTSTIDAMKDGGAVIEKAMQMASLSEREKDIKKRAKTQVGMMQHILSGLSYMGMLCIVAGMLFAIASFGADRSSAVWSFDTNTSVGLYLSKLYEAGVASFQLAIPLFAGFVAKSIADKPAIAPAMMGAYMANQPSFIGYTVGGGFLSALLIAVLVGYFVKLMKSLSWPSCIEPIMGFFVIPFITTLLILCGIIFLIGKPMAIGVQGIYTTFAWIQQHVPIASFLIGALFGGMMGLDFGGPVNKVAMIIATAVFADTINMYGIEQANFLPQSATQAAISIAPISIWLASKLNKKRFQQQELVLAKTALRQGLMGISEGAIPFVKKNQHTVILASVCGSATAGGLVSLCGCKFYGGIGSVLGSFLGYVEQPIPYITWIACICAGIAVSTCIMIKSKSW